MQTTMSEVLRWRRHSIATAGAVSRTDGGTAQMVWVAAARRDRGPETGAHRKGLDGSAADPLALQSPTRRAVAFFSEFVHPHTISHTMRKGRDGAGAVEGP